MRWPGHSNSRKVRQNGRRIITIHQAMPAPIFLCSVAQKGRNFRGALTALERHPEFWMPPGRNCTNLNSLNKTRQFSILLHAPSPSRMPSFPMHENPRAALSYIDLENYGGVRAQWILLSSGDSRHPIRPLMRKSFNASRHSFPNLKVIFLAQLATPRPRLERRGPQLSICFVSE